MRVEQTVYEVPSWGVGTLWTRGELVLAHDFDFVDTRSSEASDGASSAPGPAPDGAPGSDAAPRSDAAPHQGARVPRESTLEELRSRNGDGVVSDLRRPDLERVDLDRERTPPGAERLVALLTAFFAGEDGLRGVALDLASCTPFQRRVIESLRGIPRGEIVSYGELAALAGYAGAQRAVGTLCARNRFALLVPCHRVVAADGIGGYGRTGIAVKRRLLALEGVLL